MSERPTYRYYVLALLTLTMLLGIADRLVLSVLIEDIKPEFQLSDSQIGLLAGVSFTLFYVVVGFPLGWLADRSRRTRIIAIALAFWSLMTALCGAATGFASLFAARAGVGAGEGGSGPSAQSLLADYFRPNELARALGFYMLGATLGTVGGLVAGGLLADRFGWRMTFVLLGLPGIMLAAIFYLTVREPPRGRYAVASVSPPASLESIGATLRALAVNRAYVGATLGYAVQIMIGYAMAIWMAPLMMRKFNVSAGEVGVYLGLAFALGGIPGPIAGGYLTDWLVRYDPRWRAWLPGLVGLICIPFLWAALAAGTFTVFLVLFAIGYGVFVSSQAPILSLIHISVAANQRAMAFATASFFNNLVGQALGATLIGRLSDVWRSAPGGQGLGWAVLTISSTAALLAMAIFAWTSLHVERRQAGRNTPA